MKFSKWIFSVVGIVGGAISGTADRADAGASVQPSEFGRQELLQRWGSVRETLEVGGSAAVLNQNVADVVLAADIRSDLKRAVEMTYALVDPSQLDALDELWLETLIANGDGQMISEYLVLRSRVNTLQAYDGQQYIERWLWEASGGGNCGGGNPGNDKDVGKSGEDPNDSGDFGDGDTGQQD